MKMLKRGSLLSALGAMALLASLALGISPQLEEQKIPPRTQETPFSQQFVLRVPQDFPTIQAAIDAAAEGATILIGPGSYKENLQISKSLRLTGMGQEQVRIQAADDKRPAISVLSKTPIQVHLQGFTLFGEQSPAVSPSIPVFPPSRTGFFIAGPIQTRLRQITATGHSGGVIIFSLLPGYTNPELLYFQAQAVLEETQLVHNSVGVVAASAHVIILRSNISENEIGFMGDSLYLTHSTVRKNRFWGIDLRTSSAYGPQYMGALDNNDISENNVGVILSALSEEAAGSWLWMNGNKIVKNQDYGVVILSKACPTTVPHPEVLLGKESAPIRIYGTDNELKENGKGDLCPADYPWPPGFKK